MKITDYDLGTVLNGPAPLQACNSCEFFQTKKTKLDPLRPVVGLCSQSQTRTQQDLNSGCWCFRLRADLLRKKQSSKKGI